jgi:hypothetical protein
MISPTIIILFGWGGLRVAPLRSAHAHEPGARHPQPQPQDIKRMTSTTVTTAERIRALNDAFRRTFVGGMVMITAGVETMPVEQRRSLLQKVRAFDVFTDDNDPHGEHDFVRSTRAASPASGKSTTTTGRPSSAPLIPRTPPSPRAS